MKSNGNSSEQDGTPAWGPADEAALWTLRHDHGLTGTEQDEFSQWLAADPRHRAAWAEHRWGWDELDRLAGLQTSVHAMPDPDLLRPRRSVWTQVGGAARYWAAGLAAAAAVALGLFVWGPRAPVSEAPAMPLTFRMPALIEQRELPDGSVIELNRGAVVTEHYTDGERRVRLARGEAHFKVAKDVARPFFVEAGGVSVRAVGTAFNVRLESASVEVLVTEGKVQVGAVAPNRPETRAIEGNGPYLGANERTVVSLAPSAPAPQVSLMPPAEIEARLAWQPRLLDFTDAPLTEIVAEFNRRNPVRLTLGDARLREVRLSATFRSDNVEGFVRLMESDFGMKSEWRSDSEVVLAHAGE
jgi:transmembrane sensor